VVKARGIQRGPPTALQPAQAHLVTPYALHTVWSCEGRRGRPGSVVRHLSCMDAKGENGLGRFMWVMEHLIVRTLQKSLCVGRRGRTSRVLSLARWRGVDQNEREFLLYTVFLEVVGARWIVRRSPAPRHSVAPHTERGTVCTSSVSVGE